MSSLLEIKERIKKTQDGINKSLDVLSDEVQAQIDRLVGTPAKTKKKYKKRKGPTGGKKAKNDLTLAQGIAKAINEIGDGATSTALIAKHLLKGGWKTNSKGFNGVVGQSLTHSGEFARDTSGNWFVRG